jgi:hypothetical protein
MTKTGAERSDKYSAKFDATVIGARYTATAEIAKAKQVAMQAALATINSGVRSILNEEGVFPIQTVQYQAFANKLFGICNKFAGMMTVHVLSNTAIAQAETEYTKWKAYGSTSTVLQAIWDLFSDMLGTAPSP